MFRTCQLVASSLFGQSQSFIFDRFCRQILWTDSIKTLIQALTFLKVILLPFFVAMRRLSVTKRRGDWSKHLLSKTQNKMNGTHQHQPLLQMCFVCDMRFRTHELWVPVSNEFSNARRKAWNIFICCLDFSNTRPRWRTYRTLPVSRAQFLLDIFQSRSAWFWLLQRRELSRQWLYSIPKY